MYLSFYITFYSNDKTLIYVSKIINQKNISYKIIIYNIKQPFKVIINTIERTYKKGQLKLL